jgi:hypothetical protein
MLAYLPSVSDKPESDDQANATVKHFNAIKVIEKKIYTISTLKNFTDILP